MVPSHADESTPESWTPQQIVETLAARKAEAVVNTAAQSKEAGLVIGSDTIVVLDGSVLGKPADHADAVRMLTALRKDTPCVHRGSLHTYRNRRNACQTSPNGGYNEASESRANCGIREYW